MHYANGVILSNYDERDWDYEDLAYGSQFYKLPNEFNLYHLSQPVRDQGENGSCAAFSSSAMREIQEKRNSIHSDTQFDEWMSPEFIYYHRQNSPSHG